MIVPQPRVRAKSKLGAQLKHAALALPLLLLAQISLGQSGQVSTPRNSEADANAMLKQQSELVQEKRREIEAMPDSPQKARQLSILDQIEQRIKDQTTPNLYMTPGHMSGDMTVYYTRVQSRIEDCGTRHFPVDKGESVYGKAVVQIKLDRQGNLVQLELPEPSGSPFLDAHIKRLVRASAPFGPIPKSLVQKNGEPYKNVVIITTFAFSRDDGPKKAELPEAERCRWK
jgi:protein TonB